MGWRTRKDGRHYQEGGRGGINSNAFRSVSGQDSARKHEHHYISTYQGWVCRICGKPNVPSASERGKRYVYGTQTEQWELVDPKDRDFKHGLSREQFFQLGPEAAKEKYLSASFIGSQYTHTLDDAIRMINGLDSEYKALYHREPSRSVDSLMAAGFDRATAQEATNRVIHLGQVGNFQSVALRTPNIESKRQHFVNLYRQTWGSNAGLDSKRIKSFTERELDERIASLTRMSNLTKR